MLDDTTLTQGDIDRIFVATNYDGEDHSDNDDSALCRYEFYEILVRMAKEKYVAKGTVPTCAEALTKLLTEFVLPNSPEHMPW